MTRLKLLCIHLCYLILLGVVVFVESRPRIFSLVRHLQDGNLEIECRVVFDYEDVDEVSAGISLTQFVYNRESKETRIIFDLGFKNKWGSSSSDMCVFEEFSRGVIPATITLLCSKNQRTKGDKNSDLFSMKPSRSLIVTMEKPHFEAFSSRYTCASKTLNLNKTFSILTYYGHEMGNLNSHLNGEESADAGYKNIALSCHSDHSPRTKLNIDPSFPPVNMSFTFTSSMENTTLSRDYYYRQWNRARPLGVNKHPRRYTRPQSETVSPITCFTGEDKTGTSGDDCYEYVLIGTKTLQKRLENAGRPPAVFLEISEEDSVGDGCENSEFLFSLMGCNWKGLIETGKNTKEYTWSRKFHDSEIYRLKTFDLNFEAVVFAPPPLTSPLFHKLKFYRPNLLVNNVLTYPNGSLQPSEEVLRMHSGTQIENKTEWLPNKDDFNRVMEDAEIYIAITNDVFHEFNKYFFQGVRTYLKIITGNVLQLLHQRNRNYSPPTFYSECVGDNKLLHVYNSNDKNSAHYGVFKVYFEDFEEARMRTYFNRLFVLEKKSEHRMFSESVLFCQRRTSYRTVPKIVAVTDDFSVPRPNHKKLVQTHWRTSDQVPFYCHECAKFRHCLCTVVVSAKNATRNRWIPANPDPFLGVFENTWNPFKNLQLTTNELLAEKCPCVRYIIKTAGKYFEKYDLFRTPVMTSHRLEQLVRADTNVTCSLQNYHSESVNMASLYTRSYCTRLQNDLNSTHSLRHLPDLKLRLIPLNNPTSFRWELGNFYPLCHVVPTDMGIIFRNPEGSVAVKFTVEAPLDRNALLALAEVSSSGRKRRRRIPVVLFNVTETTTFYVPKESGNTTTLKKKIEQVRVRHGPTNVRVEYDGITLRLFGQLLNPPWNSSLFLSELPGNGNMEEEEEEDGDDDEYDLLDSLGNITVYGRYPVISKVGEEGGEGEEEGEEVPQIIFRETKICVLEKENDVVMNLQTTRKKGTAVCSMRWREDYFTTKYFCPRPFLKLRIGRAGSSIEDHEITCQHDGRATSFGQILEDLQDSSYEDPYENALYCVKSGDNTITGVMKTSAAFFLDTEKVITCEFPESPRENREWTIRKTTSSFPREKEEEEEEGEGEEETMKKKQGFCVPLPSSFTPYTTVEVLGEKIIVSCTLPRVLQSLVICDDDVQLPNYQLQIVYRRHLEFNKYKILDDLTSMNESTRLTTSFTVMNTRFKEYLSGDLEIYCVLPSMTTGETTKPKHVNGVDLVDIQRRMFWLSKYSELSHFQATPLISPHRHIPVDAEGPQRNTFFLSATMVFLGIAIFEIFAINLILL
jgi:hypothetical protein